MEFTGAFIKRLRQRDTDAFQTLYTETKTMLYNYILYKVNGAREIAEDILSEVFVNAINYAGSLSLTHNVRAWLYRIAKTKVVDYIRRLGKQQKIVDACTSQTLTAPRIESPEDVLLKSEYRGLLRAAFCTISPDYQEVLQKKYIEELSVRGIARNIQKSEKAVEAMLYRGRKELLKSITGLAKERCYDIQGDKKQHD
jgi:RNA polymerase sigma-70 factor, ECF subfamily